MSPLLSPLNLPRQPETEYQREKRLFAEQVRAEREAQQIKRTAFLKAAFRAVFKRKGRGLTAPRFIQSVGR